MVRRRNHSVTEGARGAQRGRPALINALQIAPRISWSDAAGILGVHATTLAARWERLKASGRGLEHGPPDGRPEADVPGAGGCGLRDEAAGRGDGRAGGHPGSGHGGGSGQQPRPDADRHHAHAGTVQRRRGGAAQGDPGPDQVPDGAVHPAALRRLRVAAQRPGQIAAGRPSGPGGPEAAGPAPPATPGCAAARRAIWT